MEERALEIAYDQRQKTITASATLTLNAERDEQQGDLLSTGIEETQERGQGPTPGPPPRASAQLEGFRPGESL
jgi:hypothetical protein